MEQPSCASSVTPNAMLPGALPVSALDVALQGTCRHKVWKTANGRHVQGWGFIMGLCCMSGVPTRGAQQCHAVQDALLGRPQPKTAGIKEIMEAHPYVNMDPQQQVHMYRVSYRDPNRLLPDSSLSCEWLKMLLELQYKLYLESHVIMVSRLGVIVGDSRKAKGTLHARRRSRGHAPASADPEDCIAVGETLGLLTCVFCALAPSGSTY